jgi:hypothetical protein
MSIIASALKHMLAAGMTQEAILAAVAEMEAGLGKDETAERRRAKDRERKRNMKRNSAESADSKESAESSGKAQCTSSPLHGPLSFPQTPNLSPLNPPTTTPAEGAGECDFGSDGIENVEAEPVDDEPTATVIDLNEHLAETPKRGTRLPADWQPSEKLIETARKEGLSDAQIERELARFRDHWLAAAGRNATKRDWDATFRNWVREAADRQRRTGRTQTGGYGSQGGSLLRAYQRTAARFDDPADDAQ